MSGLSLWIVIAGMAVISIITRSFFVVLGDRVPLPERVLLALRYAPACALVALVTPELVLNNGVVDLSPQNFKLIAGLVAIATMLISRSMVITLAIGMGTYTALRLL
ncbi:MAG: AzlD domain-containing protein [Burkholderiaceae bacterium]